MGGSEQARRPDRQAVSCKTYRNKNVYKTNFYPVPSRWILLFHFRDHIFKGKSIVLLFTELLIFVIMLVSVSAQKLVCDVLLTIRGFGGYDRQTIYGLCGSFTGGDSLF